MPPTLVNLALGVLLAVALLGEAFDRRSLAIVAIAAALPDLDAIISLFIVGATNAVFHSVFVPLGAAGLLYWETNHRRASWLVEHTGWVGVRVAWVAIAAYALAGIGLDLFNVEGVAVLYPVSTRYYAVVGQLAVSTQEGLVQTYVQLGDGWLEVATPGTTGNYHIGTWINPTPGTGNPVGVERRIRIVDSGWQLVILLTAVVAAPVNWVFNHTTN